MKTLKKTLLSFFLGFCILLAAPCFLPNSTNIHTAEAAGNVTLNKTKTTLIKGQKLQLRLNGTKKKPVWSASDPKVAAVSTNGLVTAKKAGSVTITAKIGKKKYVCKLTVEAPSISKKTLYITAGQKYTLKMKGNTQKVTWQTSDPTVAGVSKKGTVYARKKGTATITAKIGSKKYVCSAVVETPSLSKKTASVTVGKKITLKVNGTKRPVKWSTSNKSVATVTSGGVVAGKKSGTATITAQVGVIKFNCKVTVKKKAFSVSTQSIRIPLDGSKKITVYSPTGSSMSYNVIGDSSVLYCSWGNWDNSNRCPLTITGDNTGKVTLVITEDDTGKKQKITVEVYASSSSMQKPNLKIEMDSESNDESYVIPIILYNYGSKPVRIYSDGAFVKDTTGRKTSVLLASPSSDENSLITYRYQDILAKGYALLLFCPYEGDYFTPVSYNKRTALTFRFLYDGKMYQATGSNYGGLNLSIK